MDNEHRKIELQSPADLTFLTDQIRTAARQKLDLHLPPVTDSSEPDELRTQVENLVDEFVTQVLAGMRSNISINGIDLVKRGANGGSGDVGDGDGDGDGEPMDIEVADEAVEKEEFEPFNDKLRAQLASAIQKRDALISKISAHRRETPALAARTFEQQFAREMDELERQRVESERDAMHADGADIAGIEGIKRAEDVERNWGRAVAGLGQLKSGLPETRARLERCGDVVGYLDGKKSTA
ncbi:hypothetical protein BDV95DRAFT_561559 [Massariosphaeria phaeospora]|uniref:Kinetochore protein mis14 n=1 Tax=Massariosphaeria phaeospora TaxID=100035 RepID=A0A7C8MTW9_9PLEO|nr:hypothetical protein BDV95DRAFT_561559 [Massariosphaeria phaeospora]